MQVAAAELLEAMDQAHIATNVVGMVGHGALRNVVMGLNAPRPATDDEVAAMVRLLEQALEEGSFGLTTGLEYHPGKMAQYDELAALCRATAQADGLYATHSRNRDKRYFVGFGEALDVARDTGVRLLSLCHVPNDTEDPQCVPLDVSEHRLHGFQKPAVAIIVDDPLLESDRVPACEGLHIALPVSSRPGGTKEILVGFPHDFFL